MRWCGDLYAILDQWSVERAAAKPPLLCLMLLRWRWLFFNQQSRSN
jgi:hypothetical protein